MLQAQQNLASPSANDLESRKLRMLHNSRNMGLARDGSSNSVGDLVSTVGSAMQIISPGLPRGDNDLLIKVSFSFVLGEDLIFQYLILLI